MPENEFISPKEHHFIVLLLQTGHCELSPKTKKKLTGFIRDNTQFVLDMDYLSVIDKLPDPSRNNVMVNGLLFSLDYLLWRITQPVSD